MELVLPIMILPLGLSLRCLAFILRGTIPTSFNEGNAIQRRIARINR